MAEEGGHESSSYLDMSMANLERVTSEGSDRYVGTDIAAGILGGLINGVEGIAETGTMLIDLFAGTKYSREMNEWVDEMKESTGLTAHGTAGEIAEAAGEILTYLVPVGAAARIGSAAGRAGARALAGPGQKMVRSYLQKNAGKTSTMIDLIRREGPKLYAAKMGKRVGQFVGTGLGAGLADAVVMNDGRGLIADYFTPDGWDESIGKLKSEIYSPELSAEEDAMRRIRNKLRAGAEGMGGYAALKGIGLGFRGIGAAAHLVGADEFIGRQGAKIGSSVNSALQGAAARGDDSLVSKAAAKTLELARPYGLAPDPLVDLATSHRGELRSIAAKTDMVMQDVKNQITKLIHGEDSKYSEWLSKMEPHERDSTMSMLERFFDPSISDDLADKTLSANAKMINQIPQIRGSIKKLQENLIEELRAINYGDEGVIADKIGQVFGSIGSYAHRSYRLWDDVKFRAPKGKDRKRIVEATHKLLREGVKPDATLDDAKAITNSIWNNRETFTTAAKRRYSIEEFDEGSQLLRQNINALEEGTKLDTPKGRMDRMDLPRIGDTEVAAGGAGSGALKSRGHVDPVLRDIYGEYTNPQSVAINTIRSIASDTANLKFMNEIDDLGLDALDGTKMIMKGDPGGAPMRGYKQIPNTPLRFGKLAGKMVHDTFADEILQSFKIHPTIGDKIWGAMFTMKGGFQASKTVLSPLTGYGNVISNIVPTAARMNFFRGGGSLRESMGLVLRQLRKSSTPEDLKLIAKAAGLNLSDSIVDLNQSLDLLEEGMRRGNFSFMDNLGRAMSKEGGSGPLSKVMNKAQDLYRGEDDVFKLFNYFAEKAKYSDVLPWMDAVALDSNRTGLSILDLIAAGNTRSMLPSFDRMPRVMKNLRKIPFAGNFSSFAAESIRTSFNGIHMGLNEMAGRFRYAERWIDLDTFRPGNEDALNKLALDLGWVSPKTGRPINFQKQVFRKADGTFMNAQEINSSIDYSKKQLARIGTRSVVGNLAAQSSMAYSIPAIGSMMTGISKEEVDAFKRDFARSYDANGSIVPIGRRHDGGAGFEYVNLAPINYYSTMQSTVKSFINEYQRSAGEGKGNVTAASNAMLAATLTGAEPFIGLSVPFEKLMDVGARNGRTREGSIVFRDEDMLGTKLIKVLAHTANAYMPGVSPVSMTWDSSFLEQVRAEDSIYDMAKRYGNAMFTPGPTTRGALVAAGVDGFDRTKFGMKVDPLMQFLPYMIRLRSSVADPVQSLTYEGRGLAHTSRSVANAFTQEITRKPSATADDVMSAFMSGQRKLFKAHKIYSQKVDTAGKMGMSENDIRSMLKDQKIGHREEIIKGTFPPLSISVNMKEMLQSRGLSHVVDIANGMSNILSSLDIGEDEETFEQVMREILYGDTPTQAPVAPEPTSTAPRLAPTAPGPQASAQQISLEQLAAASQGGGGDQAQLAMLGKRKKQLAPSPTLLPNPKDLELAQLMLG